MIGRHIHFSGEVQGVGFRRRTRDIATGFQVTGYVRNLPDGRVELRVDGAEAEVERFLAGLRLRLGAHVTREESSAVAPGGFTSFDIRRD